MEISIAVCEVDTKKHFHYNFNFKVLFLNLVFPAFKDILVLEWVACISACIGTFWISSIVVKFSPFSATDVLWQLACHRRCWWCWHWPRLVKALCDIVAALFQFTVRKSSGARMPTGSTRRTTRSSRCWSSCWRPAMTRSSSAWPRSTSENTSATIRAENSEFKKSSHCFELLLEAVVRVDDSYLLCPTSLHISSHSHREHYLWLGVNLGHQPLTQLP